MGGTQSAPAEKSNTNASKVVNTPRSNATAASNTNSTRANSGNVKNVTSNASSNVNAGKKLNAKYKNVVVNEQVKQKVEELNTLIANFNKNDVKTMMSDMQRDGLYQDVLTPELTNKITNMHEKIVKQISSQTEIQTNAGLRNVIYKVVNQDIDEQMNRFLQDPVLSTDDTLKEELGSILNNIKTSHMKYKYFEYKYVQLNLFVLGFIRHVYQTMGTFVEANLEAFENREKYRNELTLQFMNSVKKMIEGNDLTINDSDLNQMSNLMEAMKKDIDDKGKELKTNLRQIANTSVNSITTYVDKQKDGLVGQNLNTGAIVNKNVAPTSTTTVV